ncbi:hypothetical protein EN813_028100 [Mesorhizobium sp. M00.F.Ca.ET.170.01.1.1]|nr:hypothetical protein EN813_028100 [Mesorhizobium sp. M00.F.Ca.ET.170.01.1.1]
MTTEINPSTKGVGLTDTEQHLHPTTVVAGAYSALSFYTHLVNTSYAARHLTFLLSGRSPTSATVLRCLADARELQAMLGEVALRVPLIQRDPGSQPARTPDESTLTKLLSAASSDARYLKSLTRGGAGMSQNMVTPQRVIVGLIAKLEKAAEWSTKLEKEEEERQLAGGVL